ncbi:MAG TPA: PQQ-binding-like beta-propeller repeat protein [Nevskiaceae bacterium]|nr:PQQ-binding-like beta-propeller repeat protein [Nevskiaceae bacterium]
MTAKLQELALAIAISAAFPMAQAATMPANSDWPSYNRTLTSERYSPLAQINQTNVSQLRPACELKLGEPGSFESGIVVIGNVLYVTTAHTTVAMNASDCKVLWRNVHQPKGDVVPVNRGVAYADGRVFRGFADGYLEAISARTGKTLWTVHPANAKVGEFLSAAPIAWHGLVFIGLAGSDWGIRGKMMAFDARTGKEVWHFWTIPEGKEPGADTWTIPATIKHGGGGTWTSYTLDPKTGTLFIPVANPSPDLDPKHRPGDNLFTNSVVALDARTGKLKWWYQLTPHDGLDYDLAAAPLLYTVDGQPRVGLGSKDGYFYALDRKTHKLLFKTPITTIKNSDAIPTLQGVHVCPGDLGGVEWNGPAFDPRTQNIYVGAVDWCTTYKLGKDYKFQPGGVYFGTSMTPDDASNALGWVTAIEAGTGKVAWKFHAPTPVVSGVTPTAGGVVFAGDMVGTFYAFDAKTGKVLLKYPSGGAIAGGVVTYSVAGTQYVTFASGNMLTRMGSFSKASVPTVVVMSLKAPKAGPEVVSLAAPVIHNPQAHSGRNLFMMNCAVCHGPNGEGGQGPKLQGEASRKNLAQVIEQIKNPAPPMPKLFPNPLSEQDVETVAKYVEALK